MIAATSLLVILGSIIILGVVAKLIFWKIGLLDKQSHKTKRMTKLNSNTNERG